MKAFVRKIEEGLANYSCVTCCPARVPSGCEEMSGNLLVDCIVSGFRLEELVDNFPHSNIGKESFEFHPSCNQGCILQYLVV